MYTTAVKSIHKSIGKTQNRENLPDNAANQLIAKNLASLQSSRMEVPAGLSEQMNEKFGINGGQIKLFADKKLSSFGEDAYARANEIHYDPSRVDFSTGEGAKTFMHEAAHIAQQASGMISGSGIVSSDSIERNADTLAENGMSGSLSPAMLPSASASSPLLGLGGFKGLKKRLPTRQGMIDTHDTVRDKIDDMKDSAKAGLAKAGGRIRAAYQGSALQKGVGKITQAGSAVKKAAGKALTSAGGAIKSAYQGSALQTGVDAAKGAAKSVGKFAVDTKDAAVKKIQTAYAGSSLEHVVTGAKQGVADMKDKVAKSKFGRGVTSAGQAVKKFGFGVRDKIADKIFDYREHEDERYMKRQMRKDPEYVKKMQQMEAMLAGMDTVKARKDTDMLDRYSEDQRQYLPTPEDEEHPEWSAMTEAMEPLGDIEGFGEEHIPEISDITGGIQGLKGKNADKAGDTSSAMTYIDTLKGMKETFDTARSGNGDETLMSAADLGEKMTNSTTSIAMKSLIKAGKISDDAAGSLSGMIGGGAAIGTGSLKGIMHGVQKSRLSKLTDAQLSQHVSDDRDKAMIASSRDTIKSTISRKQVDDAASVAKGGITMIGAGADMGGAGGAGSLTATGLGMGVNAAAGAIKHMMKSKDDKAIMHRDIFGSQDEYERVRDSGGLSDRAMHILIRRATGSRYNEDVAESSRIEQAQRLHKNLGGSEETGADEVMKAVGYKSAKSRQKLGLDDIKGLTDATMGKHSRERGSYDYGGGIQFDRLKREMKERELRQASR